MANKYLPQFNNKDLLKEAMTHRGYGYINKVSSNQKLEFLGDKVINLIIATLLWQTFPLLDEGQISIYQAHYAGTESLAKLAKKIGLDELLLLDPFEEARHGRENQRILEDATEAFFAALYLDQGFDKALAFAQQYIQFDEAIAKDPKSTLQELCQQNGYPLPCYQLIEKVGPSHDALLTIEVSVGNLFQAKAIAKNKKAAERQAALNLLSIIKDKQI